MTWKCDELPEECQNCIHLKAFSIFMSGDEIYSCRFSHICGKENDWAKRKSEE